LRKGVCEDIDGPTEYLNRVTIAYNESIRRRKMPETDPATAVHARFRAVRPWLKEMTVHLKCILRTCIATHLRVINDHVTVMSPTELAAQLELVLSLVDAEEELV